MLQEGRGWQEGGSCRGSPPCTCDLRICTETHPQRKAQNEGIAGEELREAALAHSLTAHFLGTGIVLSSTESQGESWPTFAIRVRGAVEAGAQISK